MEDNVINIKEIKVVKDLKKAGLLICIQRPSAFEFNC